MFQLHQFHGINQISQQETSAEGGEEGAPESVGSWLFWVIFGKKAGKGGDFWFELLEFYIALRVQVPPV